jgi:hypothetical protein
MTQKSDNGEPGTGSARGEAAWKEERERVADRNAKTRKAGREQRESYEREKADARRAAERRQLAELIGERSSRLGDKRG